MSVVAIHDSQAIALLCAPIAIGDDKPLTPSEWAKLASTIHSAGLRPGVLSGLSASELAETLELDGVHGLRIAALLERGGTLAFELERLADRGIWLLTRADDEYPARVRQRLGLKAAAVLFGVGGREHLEAGAVAIVGSRDASKEVLEATAEIGRDLGRDRVVVVSGGARGVDRAAMESVVSVGGSAIAFVADSLVRLSQQRDVRQLLADDQLTLLTPFGPEARFTVGNAMARNKLIYCAADAAVVVATAQCTGGTWAGATEALEAGWVPVWAWRGRGAPHGNASLLERGARSIDVQDGDGHLYERLVSDVDASSDSGRSEQTAAAPDLLAAVWPDMEPFLRTPRSEDELVEHFALERAQIRAWMKRCIESGLVAKSRRPVRYSVTESDPTGQDRLFDSA